MTIMTKSIEVLKKLKVEAQKYEGCLAEWAGNCGVKPQTLKKYFDTKQLTPTIENAIEKGILTIAKYQAIEDNLVKKAMTVLNR